VEEDRNRELN